MENHDSNDVSCQGNFAYAPLTGHIINEAENGESQLQNKRDRLTTLSDINAEKSESLAPKYEVNIFGGVSL